VWVIRARHTNAGQGGSSGARNERRVEVGRALRPAFFQRRARFASADALLGADHPLTRVLDRISAVREQAIVVAVLIAASIVTLVAGVPAAPALIAATAVVETALLGALAVLTSTRRERVLELIIEGHGLLPLAPVAREVQRLADATHRKQLAHSLDQLRQEAEHPVFRPPSARPLFNRRVLDSVAPALRTVSVLLRSEFVDVRGVALTERLLTAGGSPLYGRDVDRLRQELGRVQFLLGAAPWAAHVSVARIDRR
jgi:hypothetical protein